MDIQKLLAHQLNSLGNHVGSNRYLLAVSGGVDSMVLLHAATAVLPSNEFAVAHCNFQLRGNTSDGDALLVREYCTKQDVPYFETSFNTQEYALREKLSIEMAARELRYRWFHTLCDKLHCNYIITAHHKNDQVETFLINLTRGSGIHGLTGMKVLNGAVFRPFLDVSRQQIEHYADQHHVAYRADASNEDTIYVRNKFRKEIIPSIEVINPSFVDSLTKTMHRLGDAELFIEEQLKTIREKTVQRHNNEWRIHIPSLFEYKSLPFVLFELLRPFGFKEDVITQIQEALKGMSGKQFFSSTHRACTHREFLIVSEIEPTKEESYLIDSGVHQLKHPICLTIETVALEHYQLDKSTNKAFVDLDLLEFPLLLRRWRKGDTFYPIGMNHAKKLSDFFIDQKFSVRDKENAWILESGNHIVWIVGKRLDNRFKITPNTTRIGILTLH